MKGAPLFLPALPSFPAWRSGFSTEHHTSGPYTSSPHGCSPWAQGPSAPQRMPCGEASAQMPFHESRWRGDQFLHASEEMEGMFPKLNALSLPGAFYTCTAPMMSLPILNTCHLCVSIEKSATNTHRVFPSPDCHTQISTLICCILELLQLLYHGLASSLVLLVFQQCSALSLCQTMPS